MKRIFPLIIAGLFTGPANAQKPFTGTKAIVNTTFIYQKNDVTFPECHASTVVETGEGLVGAWFGETEERHQDVCIYTARRINGKWEKPALAADGKEDGTKYPCWNPVTLQDGRQLLVLNPLTKGRNIPGVALSKDGQLWQAALLPENDPDPGAEYS